MVDAVMAVLGAVVVMATGMVWYSPAGFGRTWMRLSGFGPERLAEAKAKGMGGTYATAFVNALVLSAITEHFFRVAGALTFGECLTTALLLWAGFQVTTLLAAVLWEGRSMALFLINAGCYLVTLSLIAALWYLWIAFF